MTDEYLVGARKAKGFLGVADMIAAIGEKNTVLDVYSVLIAEGVVIGAGNVFYPNVVIERTGDAQIIIGNDNVFYPGTYVMGSSGVIRIGNNNDFGSGGCTIKSNTPDATIAIGDGGRYCDGVSIMGKTNLGSGSQVLGNITVQSCTLAGGGNFQEPDPDNRAAVLKGFGLARAISLEVGRVVNGAGNFATAPVEWQHDYHPKPQAK